MKTFRAVPTGLAVLGAVLVACGEGARPARSPFVAVWVDPQVATPRADDLQRFAAAGAREIFLEAASLSWQSGVPRIAAGAIPAAAKSVPTTLVVSGIWAESNESARTTALAWRQALDPLWLELTRRSYLPVGLHFELEANAGREALADTLLELRRDLPHGVLLSVAVDPRTLELDGTRELSRSVDFVVSTVWGQPPGEPEDGARWDLDKTTAPALADLERLGIPYAIGAWTLGTTYRKAAAGSVVDEDPTVTVEAAMAAPGAQHMGESLLQGIDRQVNEWTYPATVQVGSWRLDPGDSVRCVRPATANLEKFLERSRLAGNRRLGVVLRRLASAREAQSLPAESLAAALEPGAAEPRLELSFEALPGSASRRRFRFALFNRNGEPTDFGGLESNVVELRFEGAVAANIDPGDFASWEPLWQARERRTLRALREADTLRFHATRVGGHQRLESGPIEVSLRGGAVRLIARGNFFLPGGRVLELAESSWSFDQKE
jgi:hypothetical protein